MTTRSACCRNCAADFNYEAKGGTIRPLCERCEVAYRWCTPCGYALPLVAFHSSVSTRGGLDALCKRCRSERSRSRHVKRDPRKDRDHKLRTRYGISLEEYERRVAAQEGKCAICRRTEALVVDHCHSSGDVRGLLCSQCNKGLGHYGDDPVRLLAAADYLLAIQAVRTKG